MVQVGDMVVKGTAFRVHATTTLDTTGAGEATIQPPGVVWYAIGMSVETATATLHPTATVQINGGFVEGTYSGHRDASNSAHVLQPTDVIKCTWTGGDAGTRATFRIWGTQYPVGMGPQ